MDPVGLWFRFIMEFHLVHFWWLELKMIVDHVPCTDSIDFLPLFCWLSWLSLEIATLDRIGLFLFFFILYFWKSTKRCTCFAFAPAVHDVSCTWSGLNHRTAEPVPLLQELLNNFLKWREKKRIDLTRSKEDSNRTCFQADSGMTHGNNCYGCKGYKEAVQK